jgi:tetratricopeptide (TPR) repeat protein
MYYLYSKKALGITSWRLSAFFLISLLTFQSSTFANNTEKSAQNYRTQGYDEQKKGNFDKALALYTKALELGIENEVLYNDIGVIYEQLGDWQQARAYYLKSINHNPDYLPPYTNLAYLYQTLGDIQNAENYFRERYLRAPEGDPWKDAALKELLRINPHFKQEITRKKADQLSDELVLQAHEEFSLQVRRAENHYQAGESLLERKSYAEAIAEFDRALLLTPGNPKIIRARQQAYYLQKTDKIKFLVHDAMERLDAGDMNSARDMFQEILSLLPEQPVQPFE